MRDTVLLIDDEDILLSMAKMMFPVVGYPIIAVNTEEELFGAIEKDSTKIVTVVLDQGIFGERLDSVVKQIWKLVPEVVVVISSGNIDPDLVDRVKNIGSNILVLKKPYLIREVEAVMNESCRLIAANSCQSL